MKKNIQKPAWRIISNDGLRHLWFGWRGISFLLIFSIFLSIYVVLLSINPEINVVSHLNWINLTIKIITMIGVVVTLLLSANSISGERDNETLEVLLLTPIKRSHIVLGKILPILSLWLGMVLVTTPYLWLISQGSRVFVEALAILLILGTITVVITSFIGALISSVSAKNINSFIVSFGTLSALIAPMQLPSKVQELSSINWFINLNPFTAMAKYQQLVLTGGSPITQHIELLISPLLILIILVAITPKLFDNYLSLSGGIKKFRVRKTSKKVLFIVAGLFLLVSTPFFTQAHADPNSEVSIKLNKSDISMTAGDWDSFSATITNEGENISLPLIATANIIRTSEGLFADPEDIFTPITHYIKPMKPGETIVQKWKMHGVFEGRFMLFISVISQDTIPTPSISPAISVNILRNKILPMNQVIPIVSIIPLLLSILLAIALVFSKRKIAVMPSNP